MYGYTSTEFLLKSTDFFFIFRWCFKLFVGTLRRPWLSCGNQWEAFLFFYRHPAGLLWNALYLKGSPTEEKGKKGSWCKYVFCWYKEGRWCLRNERSLSSSNPVGDSQDIHFRGFLDGFYKVGLKNVMMSSSNISPGNLSLWLSVRVECLLGNVNGGKRSMGHSCLPQSLKGYKYCLPYFLHISHVFAC